jgi:hypothetical protein
MGFDNATATVVTSEDEVKVNWAPELPVEVFLFSAGGDSCLEQWLICCSFGSPVVMMGSKKV